MLLTRIEVPHVWFNFLRAQEVAESLCVVKFYPHTLSFKNQYWAPNIRPAKIFLGNQWLLALSEVNEKMAATFAAPAMKKRKERKKKEQLEERISKLEEEVKKLKKQLEGQD